MRYGTLVRVCARIALLVEVCKMCPVVDCLGVYFLSLSFLIKNEVAITVKLFLNDLLDPTDYIDSANVPVCAILRGCT